MLGFGAINKSERVEHFGLRVYRGVTHDGTLRNAYPITTVDVKAIFKNVRAHSLAT